jgi:rod shape-determining protein MreC
MSRERFQNLIPVLLVAVTLIGLISHSAGLLQPVESAFLRVTAPLQAGTSGVADRFGQFAQTVRDLRTLRQRNEELEAENARLLLDNVRLREIAVEAALLRDLLNVPQASPSFAVQGARVVGRIIGLDPSNLQRYVLLDVGQESGIARNMPVVNDRGLVGRITEAGVGWSRVLLITDMSSSVNVLTQSTRASGLVQGQPDGSLIMEAIPQSDTVSVGDTVFTSGLGGNFPRQILIGQVIEVQRRDYELYQTAIIQPTVDFDHMEVVLVITDFESARPLGEEGR